MPTLAQVHSTKHECEADFLGRSGVTGVGVGYKYVEGERTSEICVQVFVEKKKKQVAKDEKIPATVDNVKTDVIERVFEPMQRAMPVTELEPLVDTGTYDPLQGGISIGPCRVVGSCIFVGTLGAIVEDVDTNDRMMLSNFHVMCVDNNWSVGDEIAQPRRVDGGSCPSDVVGELRRATLGGEVDGAVATITDRTNQCEIVGIGPVKGKATATLGMKVRKRGRTTELTFGTVDSVALTVNVNYDDADCGISGVGTVTFSNQIGIQVDSSQSTVWGQGGDSGSVVVNDEEKVVGLFFAGSSDGTSGVANPIDSVLSALDVKLCTGKSIFKEFKDGKHESKEFKAELKEFKREKSERKEFKEWRKERFKDWKEPKEIFEHKPPVRETFDPDLPVDPGDPFRPGPVGPESPDISGRLADLEARVAELQHFIASALRPDLTTGALRGEADLGDEDLRKLSQRLEKEAADAKQRKETKDTEKPRER